VHTLVRKERVGFRLRGKRGGVKLGGKKGGSLLIKMALKIKLGHCKIDERGDTGRNK